MEKITAAAIRRIKRNGLAARVDDRGDVIVGNAIGELGRVRLADYAPARKPFFCAEWIDAEDLGVDQRRAAAAARRRFCS